MIKHESFWIVTILRGILALLVGSAILVVPDLARTLLFLPFAIAFVILSLIIYGITDSILVFVTSFFTSLEGAKNALRIQSALGLAIGILFCTMLFDRIHLEWFLYLIAVQAFATACAEYLIARHTTRHHGSRTSYVAAGIAFVGAAGYAIAASIAPLEFSPRDIALLAYTYLAAFGVAQALIGARMLYIEQHDRSFAHAPNQLPGH